MDNSASAGSRTEDELRIQPLHEDAADQYIRKIADGDAEHAERLRTGFLRLVDRASSAPDLLHGLARLTAGANVPAISGIVDVDRNLALAGRFCAHQHHCMLLDDQHESVAADPEYLKTIASWDPPTKDADEALLLRILVLDYSLATLSLSHHERWRIWQALPTLLMDQLRAFECLAVDEGSAWAALTDEQDRIDRELLVAKVASKRPLFRASARGMHVPDAVSPCDDHGVLMPAHIETRMAGTVVGQDGAVRALALAGHLHGVALTGRTAPSAGPLLLVGPTGCGKTLAVRTLAEILACPFVHVDCSSLVTEGIVGPTVAGIFLQMLHQTHQDFEKAECGIVFLDEFDKLGLEGSYYGRQVQMQLLRAIEGASVSISSSPRDGFAAPARPVFRTGRLLFILGGSWQNTREQADATIGFQASGLPPVMAEADLALPTELKGRIRMIVQMRQLPRDVLRRIITMQDGTLHRTAALLHRHGHRLVVAESFLDAVVDAAAVAGTGARGIDRTVMARMTPLMSDLLGRRPQRILLGRDGPMMTPADGTEGP